MIVKLVTFFLVGIAVLAMFGRLRLPKINNPLKRDKIQNAKKCKKCGCYILGDGPCACARKP